MPQLPLRPTHPGRILLNEFLEPLDLSQNRLAREIGVPPRRINEIVHGKRAITADTALRLAAFFDTSAQFWLNIQARFDLETVDDERGREIRKAVKTTFRELEGAQLSNGRPVID